MPCDGRNISAWVCNADFRQKLGSIAVREFRPVICNCRAAHYNSPFLASEPPPSFPSSLGPSSCYLLPSRPSRSCNRRNGRFWHLCSHSFSLFLFASLPVRPSSLRARAFYPGTCWGRGGEGEGEARLIKTFIFNCIFNCFLLAPTTLRARFLPSRYRNNILSSSFRGLMDEL